MAKYLQGDIVLIKFPFTDGQNSKLRPCIIVSNSKVNITSDVLLAGITSQLVDDEFSFTLKNKFLSKPLHKDFFEIRCHKLFLAAKSTIIKKISSLRPEKHVELYEQITTIINPDNSSDVEGLDWTF